MHGEIRNAYSMSQNLKGCDCWGKIKMNLGETGCGNLKWIQPTQDRI